MVEYLNIFDKKYPVRIGYLVMKRVKEQYNKPLQDALKDAVQDPEIHETILFAALQMGAYAEKAELDLTRDDMPMVLDLCFHDYIRLFSSKTFFPTAEDEDEKGVKTPGEDKTPGNVKKT